MKAACWLVKMIPYDFNKPFSKMIEQTLYRMINDGDAYVDSGYFDIVYRALLICQGKTCHVHTIQIMLDKKYATWENISCSHNTNNAR